MLTVCGLSLGSRGVRVDPKTGISWLPKSRKNGQFPFGMRLDVS